MMGLPELGSLDSLPPPRRTLARSDSRAMSPTASWRNADEFHANARQAIANLRARADFRSGFSARRTRRLRVVPSGNLVGVVKNIPRVLLSIGSFPRGLPAIAGIEAPERNRTLL